MTEAAKQKRSSSKRQITEEAILAAALQAFSQAPYEAVGTRDISGPADRNHAMISRNFGGKEQLFGVLLERLDVFSSPRGPETADAAGLAHALSTLQEPMRSSLQIAIRSAGSPAVKPMVQAAVLQKMVQPCALSLDGDETELRASLVAALCLGLLLARDTLQLPALQDKAKVEARLAKMLSCALAADHRRPGSG